MAQALVQELEKLSHSARTKRMVQLGKESAVDSQAHSLIQQLESDYGYWGKELALWSCYGSKDLARCLACYNSTSRSLRSLALQVLVAVAPDDVLAQVLLALPVSTLKRTLRRVYKLGGRTSVLEAVLEAAAVKGDTAMLAECVVYGSADQVARLWPQVESYATDLLWSQLANYYPGYALGRLKALLEDLKSKWSSGQLSAYTHIHRVPADVTVPVNTEDTVYIPVPLSRNLLPLIKSLSERQPEATLKLVQGFMSGIVEDQGCNPLPNSSMPAAGESSGTAIAKSRRWPKAKKACFSTAMNRLMNMFPQELIQMMLEGTQVPVPAAVQQDNVVASTEATERQETGQEMERRLVCAAERPPVYQWLDTTTKQAWRDREDLRRLRPRIIHLAHRLPVSALLKALLNSWVPCVQLLSRLPKPKRAALFTEWKAHWQVQQQQLAALQAVATGEAALALGSHPWMHTAADAVRSHVLSPWLMKKREPVLAEETLAHCLAEEQRLELADILLQELPNFGSKKDAIICTCQLLLSGVVLDGSTQQRPFKACGCPTYDGITESALAALPASRAPACGSATIADLLLKHLALEECSGLADKLLLFLEAADQWRVLKASRAATVAKLKEKHAHVGTFVHIAAARLVELHGQATRRKDSTMPSRPLAETCSETSETESDDLSSEGLETHMQSAANIAAPLLTWEQSLQLVRGSLGDGCSLQLLMVLLDSHPHQLMSYGGIKSETRASIIKEWQRWWGELKFQASQLAGSMKVQGIAKWPEELQYNVLYASYSPWLNLMQKLQPQDQLSIIQQLIQDTQPQSAHTAHVRAAEAAAVRVKDLLYEYGESLLRQLDGTAVQLVLDFWPGYFLSHQGAFEVLDKQQQVVLMQSWARSRTATEAMLAQAHATLDSASAMQQATQSLLKAMPAIGDLQWNVFECHLESEPKDSPIDIYDGLVSSPSAWDISSTRLCDDVKELLFQTCKHGWMLASSDSLPKELLVHLPEPHHTTLIRARVAHITQSGHHWGDWFKRELEPLLGYLPFKEVIDHPSVKEMLQSREVTVRQQILEYLVRTVHARPENYPKVLILMQRRKNEQDATRCRMLTLLYPLVKKAAKTASRTLIQRLSADQLQTQSLSSLLWPNACSAPATGDSGVTNTTTEERSQMTAGQAAFASGPGPDCINLSSYLDALKEVLENGLTARDVSDAMHRSVWQMAASMLVSHLDWAAVMLVRMVGVLTITEQEMGYICTPVLEHAQALQDKLKQLAKQCSGQANSSVTTTEANGMAAAFLAAGPPFDDRETSALEYAAFQQLLCTFLQALKPMFAAAAALPGAKAGQAGTMFAAVWRTLVLRLLPRLEAEPGKVQGNCAVLDMLLDLAVMYVCTVLAHCGSPERAAFQSFAASAVKYQPDAIVKLMPALKKSNMLVTGLVKSLPETRFDLLLQFTDQDVPMDVMATAVNVICRHHCSQLPAVLPGLLQNNKLLALHPRIFSFLHTHRQDLLDGLLQPWPVTPHANQAVGQSVANMWGMYSNMRFRRHPSRQKKTANGGNRRSMAGRTGCCGLKPVKNTTRQFSVLYTVGPWLGLPHVRHTHRWTSKQQSAMSDTLTHMLVRLNAGSLTEIRDVLRRMSVLPAVPPTKLLAILAASQAAAAARSSATVATGSSAAGPSAGNAGVPAVPEAVQESILVAISHADDNELAWQSLLAQCGPDGGAGIPTVAISSLLSAPGISFDMVLERLRSLPMKKVQVAKEVVRVLARLAAQEPRALAELLSLSRQEDLHRSVAVQLLESLQPWITQLDVQSFYMRCAMHADVEVAKAGAVWLDIELLKQPGVAPFMVQLYTSLLSHPDSKVRMEAMTKWGNSRPALNWEAAIPVVSRMMSISHGLPVSVSDGTGATRSVKPGVLEVGHARSCAGLWFTAANNPRDVLNQQQAEEPVIDDEHSTQEGSRGMTGITGFTSIKTDEYDVRSL